MPRYIVTFTETHSYIVEAADEHEANTIATAKYEDGEEADDGPVFQHQDVYLIDEED